MGVNGFFPLARARAPGAFETLHSAETLRGRRLGVDAPALLHRARAAQPHAWSYLPYLAEHLLWLRELGCPSLFVFDGCAATREKQQEQEKREERKAKQAAGRLLWLARMEEASDWEELLLCREKVEQCDRACVGAGPEEKRCLKQLLSSLGFAWCMAPGEAESHLAFLQQQGYIQEIVTEDSDTLVCGARSILRNFWGLKCEGKKHAVLPQRLGRDSLLAALGVDDTGLRTAAVLAGCDFAPKLHNVGLVKALKAAKQNPGDIPACLLTLKKAKEATCPKTVAALERALELLGPSAADAVPSSSLVLGLVDRAAVASMLGTLEQAGEPWALRALLAERASAAGDLIPAGWLDCDMGGAA